MLCRSEISIVITERTRQNMDAGLKDKVSPLLNKKIALFLISQNLSLFGSSVVDFAIFGILRWKPPPACVNLYTVCAMLPEVLLSLWEAFGRSVQP